MQTFLKRDRERQTREPAGVSRWQAGWPSNIPGAHVFKCARISPIRTFTTREIGWVSVCWGVRYSSTPVKEANGMEIAGNRRRLRATRWLLKIGSGRCNDAPKGE